MIATAAQPLDWLRGRYPRLVVDHEAVLFGAATHDIAATHARWDHPDASGKVSSGWTPTSSSPASGPGSTSTRCAYCPAPGR